MRAFIDHVVITASSLMEGRQFVRRSLGVDLEQGGEHVTMGTHNLVLRLGKDTYLEVIAPNPDGRNPQRPRWFELDNPRFSAQPRLAAWAARTEDIRISVKESPEPLGNVETMNRGHFNWLITIPADGSLPLNGIAPVLIQWLGDARPVSGLPDAGCSLVKIEGYHDDVHRVESVLKAIKFEGDFAVSPLPHGGQPYLVVHIRTPQGTRQIRTSW
jgi:hypothetical protein